jgi:HK97 family phage portal protein
MEMALLRRWLGGEATRTGGGAQEERSLLESALWGLLDGARSASGVAVSEESSLRNTAVLACVRILSQSTAMLPLPVFRRLRPRGKERAPEHPLYPVLNERANPEMTAFELRRWLMQHVLLYGNGYAEIEWSESGQVRALWPLLSSQMRIERRQGALVYLYTLPTGKVIELPAWRVLHLRGLTGNGVEGWSVVRSMMNEAVGLGLATQEYGGRFFGNGARPGIVVKHPGTLSAKALQNLSNSWSGAHEGLSNAHRVRILEEGMDVVPLGVPPDEAQFLETRKFQVTEIARAFGVPPHLIGDMERATFSNIEHQYMEFLQFSLGPWLTQIEQTVHTQLMRAAERREYFVEHVRSAMLQADTATRYQAYAVGRQWGWFSVNDIRELENMNPVAEGDGYLQPLNMAPLGEEPAAVDGVDTVDGVDEGGRSWLRPIAEDVARRLARRHLADVKRAGGRAGSVAWRAEHFDALAEAVPPAVGPLLAAARVHADVTTEIVAQMQCEERDEDALTAVIAAVLLEAIGGV